MRYVFGLVCLLMAIAVLLQYNDPDGPLWMVIYGVPAIWTGIAASRPHVLAGQTARTLLAISLGTAMVLTILGWPPVGGWWQEEVWSMSDASQGPMIAEKAREGMGLMIVTLVLAAVFAASFAGRSGSPTRAALQAR